jgi:hypothetical protein
MAHPSLFPIIDCLSFLSYKGMRIIRYNFLALEDIKTTFSSLIRLNIWRSVGVGGVALRVAEHNLGLVITMHTFYLNTTRLFSMTALRRDSLCFKTGFPLLGLRTRSEMKVSVTQHINPYVIR